MHAGIKPEHYFFSISHVCVTVENKNVTIRPNRTVVLRRSKTQHDNNNDNYDNN